MNQERNFQKSKDFLSKLESFFPYLHIGWTDDGQKTDANITLKTDSIMKQGPFTRAIELISEHHSSQISINLPKNDFVGDLGKTDWTIHINKCCHSVIAALIKEGFILHMDEKGISVSYIG